MTDYFMMKRGEIIHYISEGQYDWALCEASNLLDEIVDEYAWPEYEDDGIDIWATIYAEPIVGAFTESVMRLYALSIRRLTELDYEVEEIEG